METKTFHTPKERKMEGRERALIEKNTHTHAHAHTVIRAFLCFYFFFFVSVRIESLASTTFTI